MRGELKEFFRSVHPIERMEWALVRDWVDHPGAVSNLAEQVLRHALSLARLRTLRGPDGRDRDLNEITEPLRRRLAESFGPMILDNLGTVEHGWLESEREGLAHEIDRTRDEILRRHAEHFREEDLEREICVKRLVIVGGGGGGCGYVYLGAYKLLQDHGLRPAYVVGSSIGAVLGSFRAREVDFDYFRAMDIAHRVRFRQIFEVLHTESRFGLPAALRLFLQRAFAKDFQKSDGTRLLMRDMPIPFEAVVTGIRPQALRQDMAYYENLFDLGAATGGLNPRGVRLRIGRLTAFLRETFRRPTLLREISIGGDDLTADFDVIDAVGFSAAIPGVIHYDVLRDDPHMRELLTQLLKERGVARLVDGGVVNNVPSRTAWEGVQNGRIGTRNVFILAMDCFSPQFRRNLIFHAIQRMVVPQVERNKRYAHFTKTFKEVLSPLDLVPDQRKIDFAASRGYRAMREDLPYLLRVLAPIEPWAKLRDAALTRP
ncbi:MAG: patatin-like phospholipase family protein [Myxococcales bacterium]|nr:patatin-like phospholipase family protein [Myxococcales bacterium]